MIRDYRGFGFHPKYGCEIYYNNNLKLHFQDAREVTSGGVYCFRKVFDFFSGKNGIYKGIYTLKCRKYFQTFSGNYCVLDKKHIFKVIRYMRNSLNISVKFKDTANEYVFTFEIIGKPIKHKWILTFSRVFYEWPYNEMAQDVFRIRENKFLGDINITHKSFLELYNLVFTSYREYFGAEQSLFYGICFNLDSKSLEKNFNSKIKYVQDVCPKGLGLAILKLTIGNDYRNVDLDETFDKRMEIYSNNFKKIKQFKQNEKK